jgi:hypothetical protein
MHTLKGLARFPQILTEADVLFHCYGIGESSAVPVSIAPEPAPTPEPVVEIPPPAPVVEILPSAPEPPLAKDVPQTDEEMVLTLAETNSKPELVAMAEAAGLDQSGTKAELAVRLVSHYRSQ